ncbi:dynein heavy chain [Besnoitia besnoiti]|uniref:Dynein heavy chain, cytoplasmic n=1 Tax=Besnoitia besnoiti TaxID=94643 RepID=A0A2A9M7J0_BESBE|nr:dynein heavy chain [Besnoitia besnoiti]PFH31617.1 dynein heavy chain [Besnoitia besnoiti]
MERQKIALSNFLLEICPALLNCSRPSLQSLLAKEGDHTLHTFLIDQQQQVLVVGREPVSKQKPGKSGSGGAAGAGDAATAPGGAGEDGAAAAPALEENEDEEDEQYRLFVDLGFAAHSLGRASSVAFLKRPGFSLEEQTAPAEGDGGAAAQDGGAGGATQRKTIGQQLAVLRCGFGDDGESSLDVTQLYMQRGLAPMLHVALTQKDLETGAGAQAGGAGANGSSAGPQAGGVGGCEESGEGTAAAKVAASSVHQTVNKKMAELLMAVQQAQQNVDIPLIQLAVDPVIEEAVRRAQAEGRRATVEDIGEKLHDTGYLIALQNHVNRWIKDIQKVCRMQRDASTGSAAEEVSYWVGMERAISHVEDQLKTPEAELTLQVLKQTRKVFATMTFEQDAGLKQASDMVANVNVLIRDFPVNDLLGATSVEQLTQAVRTVFMHLRKLKNATQYPLSRAYQLVEALSRDLSQQLVNVLSQQNLLLLGYEEFEHATGGCTELFRTWEEEVRQFKEMVRDQSKKRGLSERPPSKLICEHLVLQERMGELRQFRRQHHRLKEVISKVLASNAGGDLSAQKEVAGAYELMQTVDVLDVSRTGQEAWEAARKAYDDRIDRVESQITARLRDRLGASTTSGEMFRVFSQFNALFFRPRVRGAIQEYQTTLIQQVKQDLRKLQASFLDGHQKVETLTMAEVRDMAPVAGSIVWAKQLERKLEGLVGRIEDVLGRGWEQHVEGQRLRQDIDAFKARLSQNELFDSWLRVVKDEKRLDASDRIFVIRIMGGRGLELDVNFDPEILALFKEVRLLNTLHFRIPYSVKVMADEAKVLYPFVTTLRVVLRTYTEACNSIEFSNARAAPANMRTKSGESIIALLVAAYQRDAQQRLAEGMTLRWDADRLEAYVRKLADVVYSFEGKVELGLLRHADALKDIEAIRSVPLDAPKETLQEMLTEVQKQIEEQQLQHFSNIHLWARLLDRHVELILRSRVVDLINEWVKQFEAWPNAGTTLIKKPAMLEIQLRNQVLQVFPPVEAAHQFWMGELHDAIASVCLLPRLSARSGVVVDNLYSESSDDEEDGRQAGGEAAEVSLARRVRKDRTYRHIATQLLEPAVFFRAYDVINVHVQKVKAYVQTWLQYQVLWDVDVSEVIGRLSDDIETWQHLLNEIKAARSTFDTHESREDFGATVVDHKQAQSKLNIKYDAWHREILHAFGQKVASRTEAFFKHLHTLLTELEEQGKAEDPTETTISAVTFLSMSEFQMEAFMNGVGAQAEELLSSLVSNLTKFLLKLQEASKADVAWDATVESLRASERLLERQRFAFPSDWLWIDKVEGELETFQQLLRHQVLLVEQNREQIVDVVRRYNERVQYRLKHLYTEWMTHRPVSSDVAPKHAIQVLATYETQLAQLAKQYEFGLKAKQVLGLDDFQSADSEHFTPQNLEDEIKDMKGVWNALGSLFADVASLKDTPWASIVPKKVRQQLEELIEKIKKIPSRFRQYDAFEEMRNQLSAYLKLNMLITDLRTDSLKDRHWKLVMGVLKIKKPIQDVTLGTLWDAELVTNEAAIREILVQAQGETALEEFLRQVKDSWQERELIFVPYGTKTKLIKGWEDLFQLIEDQLAALQSMKMSPYFKVFEEEALTWEDKLNRLRSLLDSWVEVQRKWVYLQGVFTGSQDIPMLLPQEHQRFKGIDQDFKNIMKKASTIKNVMEVAAIDDLGRQLERLSDLLSRIQKALGEYLERQREQFARFYFVGDEDLLEMIGSARDVKVVQRHVNKLFAGIAVLDTDPDDPTVIVGMSSKEGESVPFVTTIPIMQYASLKDWLAAVEQQMVATLAENLAAAIAELQRVDMPKLLAEGEAPEVVTDHPFLKWIAAFPLQVLLLALQVSWTRSVEEALQQRGADENPLASRVLTYTVNLLGFLADRVVMDVGVTVRQRMVQIITELVHQRDVCRVLLDQSVESKDDFRWLQYMRFYFTAPAAKALPQHSLRIAMADATLSYGFEYLGMAERLIQTPLTDKCFLTLTQALNMKLGGNPFGPAGTGKTESVKALGTALGRYTLVFNCDETFDFNAMGRLFAGLCQVGAWGCFDEFNRLDEKILSAVSEQILTIQTGLREGRPTIDLLGKSVKLSTNVGIFVTMNPGYAGRSNLPDNLKQLFREIAMIVPDKQLIAQVTLFAQGFRSAERLASKIISLFDLCDRQLSKQPHYDFGLRSLKSALNSAGSLKRQWLQDRLAGAGSGVENEDPAAVAKVEEDLLLRSVCDTVVPKLVAQDVPLLRSLLAGVFPGSDISMLEEKVLCEEIERLAALRHMHCRGEWREKILQLYQIQKLQHGVMLVGPVGTGKSAAWRVLLDAMETVDGIKGHAHLLDPKAVPKEQLYGRLDSTTLEWQDGVFTAILRKILQQVGPTIAPKRHWIVFDGDVDPEWAENLNSVLDDNKLLTLPNGERLQIPSNVRLLFEVDTLKHATLATVSRCGMVWFSDSVLEVSTLFQHHLAAIKSGGVEAAAQGRQKKMARGASLARGDEEGPSAEDEREALAEREVVRTSSSSQLDGGVFGPPRSVGVGNAHLRELAAEVWRPYFEKDGFACQALECAMNCEHIMVPTHVRLVESTVALLKKGIAKLAEHQTEKKNEGVEPDDDVARSFLVRWLLLALLWGFGGSMSLANRLKFAKDVQEISPVRLPSALGSDDGDGGRDLTLLDFEPGVDDGEWRLWKEKVKQVDIEPHQVTDANLVIQTVDTLRHRHVVEGWLDEQRPFILCGPPGSGKTMTLTSVLKERTDFDIAFLNFSSGTTPQVLLKTFDQYCEFTKSPNGCVVMRPTQPGKKLIVFCDECNLPLPDKYGTQSVITFMREITETGGFWRLMPQMAQGGGPWTWVRVERVQFAGACNPPTDAGRHPMSDRFLRFAPLLFVDFPGSESLRQIYGTFNRAMLRPYPKLRAHADALTDSMVDFYSEFSQSFTVDTQPHYIYSPRELTRWKLAMAEALEGGGRDAGLVKSASRAVWGAEKGEGTFFAQTSITDGGRDAQLDPEEVDVKSMVRIYIHEGLRIFSDRLVHEAERQKTDQMIDQITLKHFDGIDSSVLQRPIIFTSLVTRRYEEVSRDELRALLQGKLRVFNEEVFNVQLVFFNEVLDHVTRIDRVLRQPLGHLLLVGASGAGKTILTKFVAWINGLSIFQIKAGRNYNTAAFEQDLRVVMKRAAIKEEKIAFILDESNALGPAFLERMNALLASGEVPGLFEGDEYTALINECKAAYGAGEYLSNESGEIFARFTRQVQRNLHIIFTMNPANPEFYNRQATSPALFNRCVIDWFGDWHERAMLEVAKAFTAPLMLPPEGFEADAVVGVSETIGDVQTAAQVQAEDNPVPLDPDDEARRVRLATSIVAFHAAVALSNKKLQRSGKKSNWMTPRDFLDFLHHFVNLVGEKADATGEQQRHLHAGLQTLRVAEEQVAEMRAALTEKEKVLTEKNEEAEKKMGQMVEQQSEAEEKKRGAEQLARRLDEQTGVIEERRQVVQKQLAEVEPLLLEAAEAVTNIPKKSLDELKSMANPPAMAKIAVEAVAVLITDAGDKPLNWDDARKVLKNQDFITKVVNFDCSNISPVTRKRVQTKFIHGGEWDLEKINRASKAAGPLAKWVESSVAFVTISEQVDPLQKEIEVLEVEALKNKEELLQQQELIGQLEGKLQQYKKDYAQLISQVESIKREMEDVQKKCARSMRLLQNLSSEKGRWSEQSDALQQAGFTFVGDSLLAAAFCAYLGFFEYAHRQKLVDEWRGILKVERVRYRADLSFVDFLSLPSERLNWVACGLPPDDLSIQNAIILKRFLRYPLIIDPAGQATNFLTQLMAAKKLTKTSFTDQNFLKALESSLRFGTTMLIQDVEKVDPILNSVLNRETHKLGGRELITVGDAEIDLSPAFLLYLATRDPTAQFTPDLCSRVTIVNFTLTPSSLVNQCLNLILKSERPDVDKRRTDMLKLQGEFKVKIRELEDGLLQALSNVKGNILDDDAVLATMENLKQQAAEVEHEAARTEDVMAEVEKTSNMYLVWALAAGRIYFMLLNLSVVSFLYQYDLRFFLSILSDTLRHPDLEKVGANDYQARLDFLMEKLFSTAYQRLAPGLRYADRLVVGLEMTHIRAEIDLDGSVSSAELQLLLEGTILKSNGEGEAEGLKAEERREWTEDLDGLINVEQMKALQKLAMLPFFADLEAQMQESRAKFKAMVQSQEPEKAIPAQLFAAGAQADDAGGEDVAFGVGRKMTKSRWLRSLREVLLVRALRPDRVSLLLSSLVEAVLGENFLAVPELTQATFYDLIKNQAAASVPVALVSSPGFDPSSKVTTLAAAYKQELTSIAMGSKEGFLLAEKAIGHASRQGHWVMFKNVHLSTKWLHGLEKQLYRMQGVHPNFRIFLTMEATPALPLNLMRVSYTFVFEPPSGVKASLLRSYALMNAENNATHAAKKTAGGAGADAGVIVERPPVVARTRLQFLLAFLHAVVLERRRYAPVGWCKMYEFSDADQVCALKIINSWVDAAAAIGKGGVPGDERMMNDFVAPERLPWDAIRTLLKQVCYGGRLDNPVDQKILSSLVDYLFQPAAFEASFPLNIMAGVEEADPVADTSSLPLQLCAPDLLKQAAAYEAWADQLWSVDSPTWLGFSAHAERLLATRQSLAAVGAWASVLLRGNEEAHDFQAIAKQGTAMASAASGRREREADAVARSLTRQLTQQMSSEVGGVPGSSWLTDLLPGVKAIVKMLPRTVPDLRRTEDTVRDPMFRCFERETTVARRLLATIHDSLAQLILVCQGETKLTNALRDLAQHISSSQVPPDWRKVFSSAPELTLAEWVEDFGRRLKHLMLVARSFGRDAVEETAGDAPVEPAELRAALTRQSDGGEISQRRVWLGGLLYPSAYLTATRQAVAQAKGWSLDDLAMEVQIGVRDPEDDQSFVITGVTVEGAAWDAQGSCLALTDSLKASVPPVAMRWWHKDEGPKFAFANKIPLDIPLFLNHSRTELVAFCKLPFPQDVCPDAWVQRGTSLFLWSDL